MPSIVRGNPITLTALTFDGSGTAVDVPNLVASIVDARGVTVVSNDASVFVVTGRRSYTFTPPADALLGAWSIVWDGTISGAPVEQNEGFTVIAAGQIVTGDAGAITCVPWATFEDAPDSITSLYDVDPDAVDLAFQIASDVLFELSGRRYPGICTDSIRPQSQWRRSDRREWWGPNVDATGEVARWGFCSCNRGRETGCAWVPEVKLPGHPVQRASIVVKIDGAIFTAWDLHDGRYLVRTDGLGWPCCQNMLVGDDQIDTFSINYTFGLMPDLGGKQSAIQFGSALFVEMNPEFRARCGVTPRTTRLTRAGTTQELDTVADMLTNGLTGCKFADMWLSSKRFGQTHRPATVIRPGRHRSARRIGR